MAASSGRTSPESRPDYLEDFVSSYKYVHWHVSRTNPPLVGQRPRAHGERVPACVCTDLLPPSQRPWWRRGPAPDQTMATRRRPAHWSFSSRFYFSRWRPFVGKRCSPGEGICSLCANELSQSPVSSSNYISHRVH